MFKRIFYISFLLALIMSITLGIYFANKEILKDQENISSTTIEEIPVQYKSFNFMADNDLFKEVVYDNMTFDELASKLDRSLNSTLSNKGHVFAKYALEYDVDPYLVTAIALYETGCKWNCSFLVKNCNNVGGVKGSPSCGSGSYKTYNSLDEGIEMFISNIRNNYYDYGLVDAYSMQRKYTGGSTTWAGKVNAYINEIKNN